MRNHDENNPEDIDEEIKDLEAAAERRKTSRRLMGLIDAYAQAVRFDALHPNGSAIKHQRRTIKKELQKLIHGK